MAGRATFTVEQGATWSEPVTWTAAGSPVDFTGYTAVMRARDKNGNLIVELTTGGGGITIATTTMTLAMTAVQTAALTASGDFDLYVTSPGGVTTRLLWGPFDLVERVTV